LASLIAQVPDATQVIKTAVPLWWEAGAGFDFLARVIHPNGGVRYLFTSTALILVNRREITPNRAHRF